MAFGVSAAFAAYGAGTLTAAMVATAVVDVGVASVVVGEVTGSKDLIKAGGYLTLAGGIGGMVAGAAGAGAAAGTEALPAGGMTATGTTAAGTLDASGNVVADNLANNVLGDPGSALPGASTDLASSGNLMPDSGAVPPPSAAPGLASGTPPPTDPGTPLDPGAAPPAPPRIVAPIKPTSLWSSLDPTSKAGLMQAGLGLITGAASQSNFNQQNQINRDRVDQTSHGSQVPRFGIINKAKGA